MAQGTCNNHSIVEAVWKEGDKNGRHYGFWSCPKNEKDQYGNWIKCKVTVANTPSGKFEQSLDKSSAQMDNSKKDELITRTAIAKELIGKGLVPSIETWKIANAWVDYCLGKSVSNMVNAPKEQPITGSDDIKLEDIPF